MSDLYELCGSSLFHLYSRIFRENYLGESEFYRLIDPFLESEDIFHHSGQRYFPEENPFPERFVFLGRDDRGNRGEIDSRFRDRESAGDIDIDIIAFEFRIAPLGEDGNEKVDFPIRDSAGGSLGVSELRIGSESFYLYDDRAIPFESDAYRRTGKMFVLAVDEFQARVGDIDESRFGHTKQPNLIGRTVAVFECTEDAIVLVFASFEEKYRIDQVFENLRTGDNPLLRDMPDEDDGTPRPFGKLHKYLRDIANLCDTSRLRCDIERRYHTHGIYDDESGPVPFECLQDIFQSMCREDTDMLVRDAETICSIGYLVDVFLSGNIHCGIS